MVSGLTNFFRPKGPSYPIVHCSALSLSLNCTHKNTYLVKVSWKVYTLWFHINKNLLLGTKVAVCVCTEAKLNVFYVKTRSRGPQQCMTNTFYRNTVMSLCGVAEASECLSCLPVCSRSKIQRYLLKQISKCTSALAANLMFFGSVYSMESEFIH